MAEKIVKIVGSRMDAHFQIHGVDNLNATLKFTMKIKEWKRVKELIAEHRDQVEYSTYAEFVTLIAKLLNRVSDTSFVEELEYAKEESEEEHVKA